ncbi:MAG: NAD(P)/FAD-dependent oxidoreductase [Clostridium sp.]
MDRKVKIGIIGAGAAGLTAAIYGARFGASILMFEQLDRVGKKILATGNGRCNITNINIDISRYHGQSPKFALSALREFSSKKVIDFFEDLGVHCKVEDMGKVFPYSDQASSILDVLRHELEYLGVSERINLKVTNIKSIKDGFKVITDEGSYSVDKVIICTGGKSCQKLGSTGLGYKLARELGHSLVEPFPALVQIKLDYSNLKSIKGVKFQGSASVISNGKKINTSNGEILFTDYGISGPPILNLSRDALKVLDESGQCNIEVDMFKDISHAELSEILKKRIKNSHNKSIEFSLVGLINKKLIPTILKDLKIEGITRPSNELSNKQIDEMCSLLKKWTFKVTGSTGWEFSQVTAGGVNVRDINPKTMESKIQEGLYFAGEVLDIDGDCGGFNLQWAWSSAYVAALNATNS